MIKNNLLSQVKDAQKNPQSKQAEENKTSQVPAVSALDKEGTHDIRKLKYIEVEPSRCRLYKYHNRNAKWFESERSKSITESIRLDGQKQLGLLRKVENDYDYDYEIIYGARRWNACAQLGIKYRAEILPADTPDKECVRLTSIENEENEDTTDFEDAMWYDFQMEEGLFENQAELAETMGKTKGYISRFLKAGRLRRYKPLEELIAPHVLNITVRQASGLVAHLEANEKTQKLIESRAETLIKENSIKNVKQLFLELIKPISKPDTTNTKSLLKLGNRDLATWTLDKSGNVNIKISNKAGAEAKAEENINKILKAIEAELKEVYRGKPS